MRYALNNGVRITTRVCGRLINHNSKLCYNLMLQSVPHNYQSMENLCSKSKSIYRPF